MVFGPRGRSSEGRLPRGRHQVTGDARRGMVGAVKVVVEAAPHPSAMPVARRANPVVKALRQVATVLGVPISALIGSLLAILVWPLRPSGDASFWLGRAWARLILWLGGVRVEVRCDEELPRGPFVFVANHSSNLDIWLMLAHLKYDFRFISKKEWGYLPLFGWAMRACGMIFIDRGDPRAARNSINAAVKKIRDGRSILLFPEGTRSRTGELMEFKRGAVHLAVKAKALLVPVAIKGAFALMPPDRSSVIPGTVIVRIGRPIQTSDRSAEDRVTLAEEARRQIQSMLREDTQPVPDTR
jgi:1-acyl-sn-glycerol-3-phosphate acyltransferase